MVNGPYACSDLSELEIGKKEKLGCYFQIDIAIGIDGPRG